MVQSFLSASIPSYRNENLSSGVSNYDYGFLSKLRPSRSSHLSGSHSVFGPVNPFTVVRNLSRIVFDPSFSSVEIWFFADFRIESMESSTVDPAEKRKLSSQSLYFCAKLMAFPAASFGYTMQEKVCQLGLGILERQVFVVSDTYRLKCAAGDGLVELLHCSIHTPADFQVGRLDGL